MISKHVLGTSPSRQEGMEGACRLWHTLKPCGLKVPGYHCLPCEVNGFTLRGKWLYTTR